MLEIKNLKKSYIKNKEILSNVNYKFESGKVYPILGGQGSGRTTLFQCICEDVTIDSGEIILPPKEDAFYAAKQSVLPMYITGGEFLNAIIKRSKCEQKADYFLKKAHISEKMKDRFIFDYSFENKKRLQIAAYLIQRPAVFMMDEPFDYCKDKFVAQSILTLENENKDGVVLISTGQLKIAQLISEDILILNQGELHLLSADMLKLPEVKHAVKELLGETDEEII